MEALAAETKASGWLKKLDTAKGLGLRSKSTQVFASCSNGELTLRPSASGPVEATEQLGDCSVSTVTKKGLAHGLRIDLAVAEGSAPRSIILGAADSDDSAVWLAALQSNAGFVARLDDLRRAANAHAGAPAPAFAADEAGPAEVAPVAAAAADAERERYAQVLQLTVEQALDPAVLSATFRSSLQQVDKHTGKERHQELLAAKRYFEREHRGQREARRSQRQHASAETGWSSPAAAAAASGVVGVGVGGGGGGVGSGADDTVAAASPPASAWAGAAIPEHPALRGAAAGSSGAAGPARAAAADAPPGRGRLRLAGPGTGGAGGVSPPRAQRAVFPAREWSVSDVRSWASSVAQGSAAVAMVGEALEAQQVDGEALEAIPSYEDLLQIVAAGMAWVAARGSQQPGAPAAGPVLKLWRRLQAMKQDGVDAFEYDREAAAMAALQAAAHDTDRLEHELTGLRSAIAEEQERSQQMLLELSSLKGTTMQVAAAAAAAAAAAGGSSSDGESDDWDDEYASSYQQMQQPPSMGTSSRSSDELMSPTARSDWASDGEQEQDGGGSSGGMADHELNVEEMERRMMDGTRLQDPFAINDLLLQSLSFGDELDDARVRLQERYAELVRQQALLESSGVKDLSNY